MSDILMTTFHGAGNTPPMMSVVEALRGRGHTVRVLGDTVLKPDIEAAGAEHVAWTEAPQRTAPGRDGDFFRDWESPDPAQNFAALRDSLAVGPAARYAADTLAEIARRRPDVLLTEVLIMMGPLIAAEATGIPSVVVNPTINIVPAPGVPPFGFGFDLARDDADLERDRMFGQIALDAWDVALPTLNQARSEYGLAPLEHTLDQARSAALMLVMTSDALDFPGELPPTVQVVGPRLADPSWVEPWAAPAGDAPLVLGALSSDYQAQETLLANVVAALGRLEVRGVVTTGRGIAPESVGEVPDHVQVVESAPHSAVLRSASAVVTHCGHGTTIKALAAGVPLVCVPLGRDQLDIAARVVHAGAGVRLGADAEPQAIADAVRRVLDDPSYAAAARRIAERIAQETAQDRAVDLIEGLIAGQ